jgi:hypothetical protein
VGWAQCSQQAAGCRWTRVETANACLFSLCQNSWRSCRVACGVPRWDPRLCACGARGRWRADWVQTVQDAAESEGRESVAAAETARQGGIWAAAGPRQIARTSARVEEHESAFWPGRGKAGLGGQGRCECWERLRMAARCGVMPAGVTSCSPNRSHIPVGKEGTHPTLGAVAQHMLLSPLLRVYPS